jgi:hypothetical protein
MLANRGLVAPAAASRCVGVAFSPVSVASARRVAVVSRAAATEVDDMEMEGEVFVEQQGSGAEQKTCITTLQPPLAAALMC